MILVDTSIWVDHIRHPEESLTELLRRDLVLMHPFIVEELACGNLPKRAEFLTHLETLPQAMIAEHSELLFFIEENNLIAQGLGAVDLHLMASTSLSFARIWSKDRALDREAKRLDIGFLSKTN